MNDSCTLQKRYRKVFLFSLGSNYAGKNEFVS